MNVDEIVDPESNVVGSFGRPLRKNIGLSYTRRLTQLIFFVSLENIEE